MPVRTSPPDDEDGGEPHYRGRRERLRERFYSAAPDALADYELLEMILFSTRPQGGTKPAAKALLERFGSLAQVIHAPELLLREVKGIGDASAHLSKLIAATSDRIAKGEIRRNVALSSWNDEYCRTGMAFADKEQFRLLFLDKCDQLIADEVQQIGTVDHTPIYPREEIKRTLELSATALILVHNDPSGDPMPSQADIQMTKASINIATPLGISVHDHIIVGRGGYASLNGMKLI